MYSMQVGSQIVHGTRVRGTTDLPGLDHNRLAPADSTGRACADHSRSDSVPATDGALLAYYHSRKVGAFERKLAP